MHNSSGQINLNTNLGQIIYNLVLDNDFKNIVDINDVNIWFDHSSIDFKNNNHAKLWYHKDIELIQKTPNIISKIPDKIDLLVLDGGEYSTYPEWSLLKDRTRFFVLDDTNILKCKKIREEILNSDNNKYTIMHDVTNDRNGYLVGYKN